MAKNNRKNQVLAVGLAIILGITIFATLVAGNVLVLSTAPTGVRPLAVNSITFKVYDGRKANPTSYAPLQTVPSGQPFSAGGNTFPDVDCFNSQPFFVSPTGATVAQPYLETQYTVIGGNPYSTEYIATGVFYGIDIGARTHAHLGAVSGITMTGATLSPWAEYTWHGTVSILGTSYPRSETIHISDKPKASGSLVFSYELGQDYNWGKDHGGTAVISQSLSPFYHEWANPAYDSTSGRVDELDFNWFNYNLGWGNAPAIKANQQRQLEYVMNHYKVAPVVVVPTVDVSIQSSVIWAPYQKQVTLPDGRLAEMDVAYSSVKSGIRSAYPSPNTDYNQAGKIATNTYQDVKGKAVMPTGDIIETPPGLSMPTGGITVSLAGVSGSGAISGYLNFNGDLANTNPAVNALFEPAINGQYTMNPDVIGIQPGRFPFSVADRTSVNGLQPSAALSSIFTMQPATDIGWADEAMCVDAFVHSGDQIGYQGFTWHPGQQITHIYYPYSITVNNVYTIQRWIIQVWTLSTYKVTLTANGAPINGKDLKDSELTSLVNNPVTNNVYQWVPIPITIDWLTILLVVLIGIAALVIFGVIMNAWASRTSVKVSIGERGGRNIQQRQMMLQEQQRLQRQQNIQQTQRIPVKIKETTPPKTTKPKKSGESGIVNRAKKWLGGKV